MNMSYEEFVEVHKNKLVAYYLLAEWYPGRFDLETPYPPSQLSEHELEELKMRLNECMPLDSMIVDLWGWDIHFEDMLSDDWYFESVFGTPSSVDSCALELADFFLEKVDEFGMDYNQHEDPLSFETLVKENAIKFITDWRKNIFKHFAKQDASAKI